MKDCTNVGLTEIRCDNVKWIQVVSCYVQWLVIAKNVMILNLRNSDDGILKQFAACVYVTLGLRSHCTALRTT
jgi:hypothetical protein